MICPNCYNTGLKVIDTGHEGEVILRRRECKECGHRFNTCEAITHVKGSRNKSSADIRKMKVSNAVAASKVGTPVRLVSQVEQQRKRAELTKRRRDAEDMEKYYSDEYVDTLVPDDEVKDLMELFGEYD